jgi:hypothetical protein
MFNAVAFNEVSMEWMVVARLQLNKQCAEAYSLSFKKMFSKASANSHYKLGSTLLGVVTDWSDGEINGLKLAVGRDLAEQLLKGCSVHWQRSCQHITDRIVSSKDKAEGIS